MSEYPSPVPLPAFDATAPEPYREIYGMPMFVTVPTADLAASKDFWLRGLGFIDLFSIPDAVTHLRRWAFQDVLLVPAERVGAAPALSISFSCVLNQLDQIAEECEKLRPGCTTGPVEMPWNSMELTIVTPEQTRVVMTAAQPLDPNSERAAAWRAVGIEFPDA